MAYAVGQTITDTLILRDNLDAPITGQIADDFAVIEAYALPSGATTAAAALSEIGSGEYAVSFTPTTAATWTMHVVYDSGGVFREFSQTYVVDTVAAASTPVTPGGTVGITRKDLRRMVMGDRLHDLLVLTATAGGTVNQFTDDVELTDAQNAYLGSQAMPTGGTAPNLGAVVRVIGSDAATHTLTVTPDLPSPTQAGDEWELVNLNGRGWRFQEVHRAINAVLRTAFAEFLIDRTDVVAAAFDANAPTVAVPDGVTHVAAVLVQDPSGDWTDVRRARRPGAYGNGYWIDRAAGTVGIEGRYRWYADGLVVKLVGKGRHPDLVDDSSLVYVDPDWLADEVAAQLAADPIKGRPALAQLYRAGAEARRANARSPRTPNLQRVR